MIWNADLAERMFTVEEANAALAEIAPLAEEMVERRRALLDAMAEMEELGRRIGGNGGGISPQDVAGPQERANREVAGIGRCIERITELGAQVKDIDQGLIDFPARRGDETVLLCWHVGEDDIRYWHGLEEGFAGRKPLPLDDG